MFWKEKGYSDFVNIDLYPLYKEYIYGIEMLFENITVDINLNGKISVKKRRIISPDWQKNIYKITIEDLPGSISFLAVEKQGQKLTIYPLVKSNGVLFTKNYKKILVDKKRNKVEFCIDSSGKFL